MADEENQVTDLSNPSVVDKYKAAGELANQVMHQLLQYIEPGQNVVEICTYGDKLIEDGVAGVSKKVKKENKGIAFPTCVAVNNCVGNLSPLPEDPATIIQVGDTVKIDLGVHIDGYICQCAHTLLVAQDPDAGPSSGPVANAICAAYFATECAIRLLRPGKTNIEITDTIKKVTQLFNVNPVEGVLSHELKRNLIDGNNVIINRAEIDQNVEEFTFELYQVYCIDIVVSTGEGKTKEGSNRGTVFKRAIDRSYSLKVQASRTVFGEITKKYPILPFTLRALDEKKRRLGIVEIVKHDLLDSYPVMYEKEGETVVQFKCTVLLLPNSTERLNSFPLPHVTSEYSMDSVPELKAIMAMSTKRKKKPVKKKAAGASAGAGAGDD